MAEEPRYSARGAYGLKKCHDSESAVVDVIFVHGLTGNCETTWTDRDTRIFWPEALLPYDNSDARILMFGYNADIIHFLSMASQNRIGNHAQNFINLLSQVQEKSETMDRPIIFVAHSLGGLMALLSSKNSAEAHLQKILECTAGITFLGTPHCGADLANWARVFGRVKDFHTMLRSWQCEGKEWPKITCFYKELRIHGIGEIVPMHSAILPAYSSIGIHKNHMDMAKFSGKDDPGYLAGRIKDDRVCQSQGCNGSSQGQNQALPQHFRTPRLLFLLGNN
ncbi:hypothetical protein BJX62DRAFT_228795 [Aspergillus germanicus]